MWNVNASDQATRRVTAKWTCVGSWYSTSDLNSALSPNWFDGANGRPRARRLCSVERNIEQFQSGLRSCGLLELAFS